ncbi:MAG: cyclic lactone autoinducer peptide [Desulfitobacteriaceae bacterium]|nr:cyclic lactone autoinducer peptide [Desulfitobacteriaceae bacterium]
MGQRKSIASLLFVSVMAFIGTLAITTPACLGWFYEPKKPEGLK